MNTDPIISQPVISYPITYYSLAKQLNLAYIPQNYAAVVLAALNSNNARKNNVKNTNCK